MKAVKVYSVQEIGLDGSLIEIECQLTNSLPSVIIVGLAGKSLDESKERLRSAFTSSEITFPKKRVILNLAPADLPKEGSSFDLAIAVSILKATKQVSVPDENSAFIGELGLDGTIRPVRGVIGKLLALKKLGYTTVYLPEKNLSQAELIKDLIVYPVSSLKELFLGLSGVKILKKVQTLGTVNFSHSTEDNEYDDIIGQERAKRAIMIAAAGHHNVLLNGPPGVGKSMLAKSLASLMPPLENEECLVVTHLHSLAENNYDKIITHRPVRAPHHSSSATAMVGGGQNPKPGEISLSHYGILFLDEFPEFSRSIIEALRQPLEDKVIRVSRAKMSVLYPAHFILVATRNPCPCGYYGTSKPCVCSAHQIQQYEHKISGPINDRIDLHVQVDTIDNAKLLDTNTKKTSQDVKQTINKAFKLQQKRFGKKGFYNSDMNNQFIKKYIVLTKEGKNLLDTAADKLNISARVYMRTLKVAQTIADLEESERINESHIAEALQYRPQSTLTV